METICQFLYYKIKYKDSKGVPDMELPIEQLLQLIVAADFLAGKLNFLDGSSLCEVADSKLQFDRDKTSPPRAQGQL